MARITRTWNSRGELFSPEHDLEDAPIGINDTELNTWFERDRQHVELRNTLTDRTICEWWDEDVTQAVENGFLNPRDWHSTAYAYAYERELLDIVERVLPRF